MVDKLEQSWATVHKEYRQKGGQKKPAGKKKRRRGKTLLFSQKNWTKHNISGKKISIFITVLRNIHVQVTAKASQFSIHHQGYQ